MMFSLRKESVLRILGCGLGRLDARSHEGKFLGYSPVDDGWVHDKTGHYLQ